MKEFEGTLEPFLKGVRNYKQVGSNVLPENPGEDLFLEAFKDGGLYGHPVKREERALKGGLVTNYLVECENKKSAIQVQFLITALRASSRDPKRL